MSKLTVNDFIKKKGYELPATIIDRLKQIDDACNAIIAAEAERCKYLPENNFSIQNICDLADVSRDTIYRVDVYKEFIDFKKEEYASKSAGTKIKELEKQLEILRSENGLLHQRDCEIVDLKRENERLTREVEKFKNKTMIGLNQ